MNVILRRGHCKVSKLLQIFLIHAQTLQAPLTWLRGGSERRASPLTGAAKWMRSDGAGERGHYGDVEVSIDTPEPSFVLHSRLLWLWSEWHTWLLARSWSWLTKQILKEFCEFSFHESVIHRGWIWKRPDLKHGTLWLSIGQHLFVIRCCDGTFVGELCCCPPREQPGDSRF